MKKITNEEFSLLNLKLGNRNHAVRDHLSQLAVGEILKVDLKEWNWKTAAPSRICRDLEQKTNARFDCFRLMDGTGWVIKRMK